MTGSADPALSPLALLARSRCARCMAGKPGTEGSQPATASSALPPRAPEGRKRPGLGFDTGPPNKRARGGGEAEGDQQAAAGRDHPAATRAAHSNGVTSDAASTEQPGDSQSAHGGTAQRSQQGGAAHGSTPSGTAPGSPTSRDGDRAERPVYTDQCTAFVKNIAPHTTDDELREVFAGCGQLQALRHLRQANGDSRVSCPPLPTK